MFIRQIESNINYQRVVTQFIIKNNVTLKVWQLFNNNTLMAFLYWFM